jgi:hypothetical protein
MSDAVDVIRQWVDATIPNDHSGLCRFSGCYWCAARRMIAQLERVESELAAERARTDALVAEIRHGWGAPTQRMWKFLEEHSVARALLAQRLTAEEGKR